MALCRDMHIMCNYEPHAPWCLFKPPNHTSCIHTVLHAGKWPDLMASKPDSVSTLGYHWTDHTGRPLEPQVHWDATGTTLADATTQWCSSGDPELICILGTHWKTTGATITLGCHWKHTGWCKHPVVSQWRFSVNLHNWNTLEDPWKATGRLLEAHWKHTRNQQLFLQWHSSVHWGLSFRHTGLPLDYHWFRVRAVAYFWRMLSNSYYQLANACKINEYERFFLFNKTNH